MLRGPQTAGELRINSERWHRFADISSVEAFLDELRSARPRRAARWSSSCPRAGRARGALGPPAVRPGQRAPARRSDPRRPAAPKACKPGSRRWRPRSPGCAPPRKAVRAARFVTPRTGVSERAC
jgi:hypothetical protein